MKKTILQIFISLMVTFGFSQSKDSMIINDSLIGEYFNEYVQTISKLGYDVESELLNKIDYLLIAPKDTEIENLARTNLEKKSIVLDNKVRLDRLMLKASLYRELSYALGIPYNKSSIIMDKERNEWFSYVAFDDSNIMRIELNKVFSEQYN